MIQPSYPPNEPAKKSYRAILKEEISAGLSELRRPASGLFLSSLSAGLELAFSLMLMGVALTLVHDDYGPTVSRLFVANMYSFGFILVILGRSELFTEHTTLAVLPLLDGQSTLRAVARVWVIVFGGNILGASALATVVYFIGSRLWTTDAWAFEHIALDLIEHEWWIIILSAMLAGWLMGQLGWVIAAARDTISQIVFVWIVTTAIGLAGLHHVVIGTAEVLAGVLASDAVTVMDLVKFIACTTLGNAVGGVFFVAIIKYGHAVRSEEDNNRE